MFHGKKKTPKWGTSPIFPSNAFFRCQSWSTKDGTQPPKTVHTSRIHWKIVGTYYKWNNQQFYSFYLGFHLIQYRVLTSFLASFLFPIFQNGAPNFPPPIQPSQIIHPKIRRAWQVALNLDLFISNHDHSTLLGGHAYQQRSSRPASWSFNILEDMEGKRHFLLVPLDFCPINVCT